MKKVNIFGHSFQKVIPILYRFITHRVKYFNDFSWNFDDYGLQIMKTQNSMSQKIRILHEINKKGYFKQKCQASEKYVHLNAFFMNYCIYAAWHGGDQPVALLRWMEAHVALIAPFGSSALLCLVSLIFLLTIPHRFSMGFRSGEFAGQSSTVIPWSLNQLSVPLAVWAGAKSYLKMKHLHKEMLLHKACQQKKAWSALKCPGSWLLWLWTSEEHSGPHQQMTWQPQIITDWKLHTGLQATWILCLSALPPNSGTLILN